MSKMIPTLAVASCLACASLAVSTPALAEEDGSGLMGRGMELFFEGLQKEIAPTLDDLEGLLGEVGPSIGNFFEEMGPAFMSIARKVEDWSLYELPEMLPNGDIIIRRKPDAPAVEPEGDGEGIEL